MPKLTLNLAGKLPPGVKSDLLESVAKAVNLTPELPDKTGSINLKLVDDPTIASLNKKYAGLAEPTDVLSFAYNDGEELGDIAISLETAQRQAQAAGTSLDDELGTLAVHGILHILGLDHQDRKEQAALDALQTGILDRAGLKYRMLDYK